MHKLFVTVKQMFLVALSKINFRVLIVVLDRACRLLNNYCEPFDLDGFQCH